MKRKILLSAVLLAFVLSCVSCAYLGLKPWGDRTPKEKSLAFMQFYNTQYRDTFNLATDPKSTPAQKELAMAKKRILKDLWPLIQVYDSIIVAGGVPGADVESQIMALINKLGGAL